MWPPQVPGPLDSLSLSGNVFITDPSGSDLHLTCSAGGLPVLSGSEESACKAGVLGPIPGLGKIPWRGKLQPTPVFLPGESHGWRSLVGYSPRGRKESDMTEGLTHLPG